MKKIGKISQIMGAVVDVSFEDGQMPNILNALSIERNDDKPLILEVAQPVSYTHLTLPTKA